MTTNVAALLERALSSIATGTDKEPTTLADALHMLVLVNIIARETLAEVEDEKTA